MKYKSAQDILQDRLLKEIQELAKEYALSVDSIRKIIS